MGCAYTKQNEQHVMDQNIRKAIQKAATSRQSNKLPRINARPCIEDDQMFQNVSQNPTIVMTKPEEELIDGILKSHFFFYKLSPSERSQIIGKMVSCTANFSDYIFKQGDPASAFFVLVQGSVQIQINGDPKKVLEKGSYFGELALIYTAPRSASVLALENCRCWSLTRSVLRNTIQKGVLQNYEIAKSYLLKMPLFSSLTDQQKDSVAYSFLSLKYEDEQIIFKQKDDANGFFIITKGSVHIAISGKPDLTLGVGDSFGEQSFIEDQYRGGTATAKGETICLSVGRESVKNVLGDKIANIVCYNLQKWAIKRSELLSKLSQIQIEKLLQNRKYLIAKDGEVLAKKGSTLSFLIVCLEGKLDNHMGPCVVGESHLGSVLDHDFVKQFDGKIAYINVSELETITNHKMVTLASKSAITYQSKMGSEILETSSQIESYKLQNFIHLKKLGEGQFGKVYLIRPKQDSQQLYALKCIQKQQVIQNKMQKIILEEKNILSIANSPFLLKFYKSYRDHYFIYFLTQYIKGAQLFDVIREIGLLNKTISCFYISSLILSVEYLHLKQIIYRDLKPQNVMVQNNGYLKLIDMGTAKLLKAHNGFRTFTIIGTPHYMAPEVMQGKGYTFAVDIWSLGVVLYEFMCGKLPFGQDLDDPYEIHRQIMKSNIEYPAYFSDAKGVRLIETMLNKIPELRMPRGFASLKAHPFFDGFDWEGLYAKKMKAPYIPKSAKKQQTFRDGTLLINVIAKEKSKMMPKQSAVSNWDSQF